MAYRSTPVFANADLWHGGILLSGPRLDFDSRVNEDVRKLFDGFVTEVKLANQK